MKKEKLIDEKSKRNIARYVEVMAEIRRQVPDERSAVAIFERFHADQIEMWRNELYERDVENRRPRF